MEFVVVRHPDIEGTAEVSRMAFDATYAEKGWQIVDDETAPADETTDPPADPPSSRGKRAPHHNPEV